MYRWSKKRREQQAEFWTPERRAEMAEQRRQWWRSKNPEKAAVRDRLLSSEKRLPCTCGNSESVLLVTDYPTGTFIWQCKPCSNAWRVSTR
jgi:hypothetical protein